MCSLLYMFSGDCWYFKFLPCQQTTENQQMVIPVGLVNIATIKF